MALGSRLGIPWGRRIFDERMRSGMDSLEFVDARQRKPWGGQMHKVIQAALCCALLGLGGCATSQNSFTGVREIVRQPQVSMIDLAGQIDPGVAGQPEGNALREQKRLGEAQSAFETKYAAEIEAGKFGMGAYRRNEIQDAIIEAANQRCLAWRNYVFGHRAGVGFYMGSAASAASAAAAAFKPESTIRGLSAAASALGASRAEFEKSFFFDITTQVIMQGIELARKDKLDAIMQKRDLPLSKYPMRQATGEAIEYHAACSVHMGLVKIQEELPKSKPTPKADATGQQAETAPAPIDGGAPPPQPTKAEKAKPAVEKPTPATPKP